MFERRNDEMDRKTFIDAMNVAGCNIADDAQALAVSFGDGGKVVVRYSNPVRTNVHHDRQNFGDPTLENVPHGGQKPPESTPEMSPIGNKTDVGESSAHMAINNTAGNLD